MKPQLSLCYVHADHLGYGYQGRMQHRALEEIGIEVFDGLIGSGDLDLDLKNQGLARDLLFVCVPNNVRGWWAGQRPHIFTMWETTELPETVRQNLHHFETVIVPSQHCVELYAQYHTNVHYVPLGIDTQRWAYRPRSIDMYFTFLAGGSGPRKGIDLVYKAFLEVFGDKKDYPIPRLILKNPRGEDYSGPDVEVVSARLSPEEEVALYASAHCYVGASRGEGWGMQPLQAMAQGCPTILTDAHGHKAFSQYGIPLSSSLVPADYFFYGGAGEWWEPSYSELCDAMWHVYTDWEQEYIRAGAASRAIHDRFSWRRSAEGIVAALGGKERLSEPLGDQGEWFIPDVKRYRVVVSRDWRADIAGVVYYFFKGKTYWESADVKRILFETGVLDPACLDGGDGLSTNQLERMGEYSASHSRCPTCGQKINGVSNDDGS